MGRSALPSSFGSPVFLASLTQSLSVVPCGFDCTVLLLCHTIADTTTHSSFLHCPALSCIVKPGPSPRAPAVIRVAPPRPRPVAAAGGGAGACSAHALLQGPCAPRGSAGSFLGLLKQIANHWGGGGPYKKEHLFSHSSVGHRSEIKAQAGWPGGPPWALPPSSAAGSPWLVAAHPASAFAIMWPPQEDTELRANLNTVCPHLNHSHLQGPSKVTFPGAGRT